MLPNYLLVLVLSFMLFGFLGAAGAPSPPRLDLALSVDQDGVREAFPSRF